MWRPAFITQIHNEGKELFKTNGRRKTTEILLRRYQVCRPSRATFDSWIFCWTKEKIEHLEKLAKLKNGRVRLPSKLKAMKNSRTRRPDLESNVYLKYRHRRDVLKLKISFNWFVATFRKEFKSASEKAPSTGKIQRFLKRRGITLQAVRDNKSKTVGERLDKAVSLCYLP